jgi:hypothetical protein
MGFVVVCNHGKSVQFSIPTLSDVLSPKGNCQLLGGAVRLSLDDIITPKNHLYAPLFLPRASRLIK